MIAFMGYLIGSVWTILSFPFMIDAIELRLWYFPAFGIILGIVWKFIFGGGNDE